MQTLIDGHYYTFFADVLSRQDTRDNYFKLAKTIFRLNFNKWYDAGFWDDKFIPYVLYDKGLGVSSVGVCVNDVVWKNTKKRYVQLSTVMTLPEYRGKGLNRWLIEYAINEWKDKCDALYLLGNDSVVNFYPKFGFEEYTEYDFSIQVQNIESECKKLDLGEKKDLDLLIKKYGVSNPFTELKVENFSQFMFHCLHFLSDNIYYLEKYDAVAIVKHEGNKLVCYDIFTDCNCQLSEVLGVLSNADTVSAYLGFTPQSLENVLVQESQEEDNHLFVLKGKENIFMDNKVLFPLLSRA